jgi:signal transduction histidine kinase
MTAFDASAAASSTIGRSRPLRRQVLLAIVSASALGVVLFGVPLAIAVQELYRGERVAQLQRDATRVAAATPETVAEVPPEISRPSGMSAAVKIGIYQADGRRLSGNGPLTSALAAAATDGRLHQGTEVGHLTVTAPVPSDTRVQVTVRVAITTSDIGNGVLLGWLAIAGGAAAAILASTVLARRQARAIALPLERLTAATTALGAGELIGALPSSGIAEADAAAAALQRTAARLDAASRRQRGFSRDVSHQLRTPLTALMLGLESALARPNADLRDSIEVAVERLHQLHHIIEELLLLTETAVTSGLLDFATLVEAVRVRWAGAHAERGRRLEVRRDDDLPDVRAPETAVRQILDVLVGNALQHGSGDVLVHVRRVDDGVAIEVTDEGAGFDADTLSSRTTRGHGLPLARLLTQLAGGSLVVDEESTRTVVRLELPASRVAERAHEAAT